MDIRRIDIATKPIADITGLEKAVALMVPEAGGKVHIGCRGFLRAQRPIRDKICASQSPESPVHVQS
jgi:hypothetical protein